MARPRARDDRNDRPSVNVYITNLAAFMPNEPVSNDDMERILGQVGDRPSRARRTVLRSNGIESRHYAIDRETLKSTHNNAQLAAEAVRRLANGSFAVDEVDCLACGTSIPDQIVPSHASMVHGELGIPPCETISASGVCLSSLSAMKYAALGVAAGEFERAVASGSELASAAMRSTLFREEIESKYNRARRVTDPPAEHTACPRCLRLLPQIASFCGYCGSLLNPTADMLRRGADSRP